MRKSTEKKQAERKQERKRIALGKDVGLDANQDGTITKVLRAQPGFG
jgi:hypothetical protein